jgi:hypothetical protein
MLRNASMYSGADPRVRMSPTWPGLRRSCQAISGHWFHAPGRRSPMKYSNNSWRGLTLPEVHERGDDADLVRRVLRPLDAAATPRSHALHVHGKRALQRRTRHDAGLVEQRNGVGRGVGSKSAHSTDAGTVSMPRSRIVTSIERGERGTQRIARGHDADRLVMLAQQLCHLRGVAEAAQRPEVVPVECTECAR